MRRTQKASEVLEGQGDMNELALFAGAGGGILGGHLLGWRTVCAVEWEPYAACVLAARQNDGILPPFPIWDDIQTFDGRPWRGIVDVVSGGFPCQDISAAGRGAGIEGERSGMWREMARVVGEVRPRYVYIENSPMLIARGGQELLQILPRSGITLSGTLWERQTLVLRTSETESGLLQSEKWATPDANMGKRGYQNPQNLHKSKHQITVNDLAMLRYGIKKLNSTLCEYLMGWPLGWTDLKPLEMDKFQQWQQQHGIYCEITYADRKPT